MNSVIGMILSAFRILSTQSQRHRRSSAPKRSVWRDRDRASVVSETVGATNQSTEDRIQRRSTRHAGRLDGL